MALSAVAGWQTWDLMADEIVTSRTGRWQAISLPSAREGSTVTVPVFLCYVLCRTAHTRGCQALGYATE